MTSKEHEALVDETIKKIIGNDLVEYSKVYSLAITKGVTKKEAKTAKQRLGIQTVTLVNGDERLWLWYIPKNVWNKYLTIK